MDLGGECKVDSSDPNCIGGWGVAPLPMQICPSDAMRSERFLGDLDYCDTP
jgi:hypothetical protein